MKRPSVSLLLIAFAIILGGCAAPAPKRLDFRAVDASREKDVHWPAPPDVPRYRFAGTLVGEANFIRQDDSETFFQKLRRWIFGEDPPINLLRPQAVIVDPAGRVIVSDAGQAAVLVFDQLAGELLFWTKATNDTDFLAPSGLAAGEGGDVFVSDPSLGYVVRLNSAGAPQQVIGRELLKRPTGLAYSSATRSLFVADTYNHVIREFASDGALVRTIGARGEAPGEFNFPTYLALKHGKLHVSDAMNARIQVLDPATGQCLVSFGSRGTFQGQFGLPKGISVDSEGNIYVVESMYDHLLVFSPEGRFLMGIGGNGQEVGQFYLPAGVWVDQRDLVFVSDMFNGRVSLFQFLGGDVQARGGE